MPTTLRLTNDLDLFIDPDSDTLATVDDNERNRATNQRAHAIILAGKGEFRLSPLLGLGLKKWLSGKLDRNAASDFQVKLENELESQNIQLVSFELDLTNGNYTLLARERNSQ